MTDSEVASSSRLPNTQVKKKPKMDMMIRIVEYSNTLSTPHNPSQLDQELVLTIQLNPVRQLQTPIDEFKPNEMKIDNIERTKLNKGK